MKPGATAWPSASIVFVAVPDSLPISAILPSLTPTSPRNAGIPEPSTTTPFLISKSYAIGFLLKAGPRRRDRSGSTLPRNFPAKAALSQHGSGPSHAKGHTARRQGSIHPCCPPRVMRRFLLALVLLAFLFGSPYAALLLNQIMGPWSATGIEQDG